MTQFRKPTGLIGKFLAKGMAWGHRDFYKNTAKMLNLKHDDKYLEIGFGSGLFIKKYASHVSRIAGLDYSEDMVKLASNINKNIVRSGKAEFIHGDISSLPWQNDKFSIVVCIETFFFWSEPLVALKEIYRVLIPGGRLVIEMAYNKDDGLDHTKHIEKMKLNLYSANEMKEILKEAGFKSIVIDYYKGVRIPFKGYVVPRGMVVKATKKTD
ncbi:MAG: methyltransferase domain-containing protein [Spirochaetota bacterium]|nr:MAG: methyltransferase domain-containing protein [Spirochaetota bacterium]